MLGDADDGNEGDDGGVGGGGVHVCGMCVCVCKQNQSFKIYPSSQRYSYPQDF